MGATQRLRLARLFKAPKDRPEYLEKFGEKVLGCKGRHQGQKAFLLGNGPTLRDAAPALLRESSTSGSSTLIGINKSHLHVEADYLCFVDRPYTQREHFLHLIEPYLPDRVFTTTLYGNVLGTPFMFASKELDQHGFSWDLYNDGVVVQTSGWFALQVACWLGFTQIYLLGFDGITEYGQKPGGNHHFYGTRNVNARESVCQFPPAYVSFYNKRLPEVVREADERGITIRTCSRTRNVLTDEKFYTPLESVL